MYSEYRQDISRMGVFNSLATDCYQVRILRADRNIHFAEPNVRQNFSFILGKFFKSCQKTSTLPGRQPLLNRNHGLSFSRTRPGGQKLWYQVKGLFTRNMHVQYESPNTSGLKVMTKVKVFVHAANADTDTRAMT